VGSGPAGGGGWTAAAASHAGAGEAADDVVAQLTFLAHDKRAKDTITARRHGRRADLSYTKAVRSLGRRRDEERSGHFVDQIYLSANIQAGRSGVEQASNPEGA
jgi:hypothetical protein